MRNILAQATNPNVVRTTGVDGRSRVLGILLPIENTYSGGLFEQATRLLDPQWRSCFDVNRLRMSIEYRDPCASRIDENTVVSEDFTSFPKPSSFLPWYNHCPGNYRYGVRH